MMDMLKRARLSIAHNEELDPLLVWNEWPWGDLWHSADMVSVAQYLFGARALRVPPRWKPFLPESL